MVEVVEIHGERKIAVKEVNSKKFDALYKKRITVGRCPVCPNYDAEIIMPVPIYGKYQNTVYIRCKQCGYETHHHSAVTCFNDTESSRFGSFVTEKSLMHAIHSAIEEWHGERSEK